MKILSALILISLLSCKQKEVKKTRYFFVGYAADNRNGNMKGNFFVLADTLPSMLQFKQDIYQNYKCENDFLLSQYVLTGVYEFKDSIEYHKFSKGYNEPLKICDEKYSSK